jgi:hypothetical protein
VRRLLIGGSPFQGWCPASEVNDRGCPGKPDHLNSYTTIFLVTDQEGAYGVLLHRGVDMCGNLCMLLFTKTK